MMYRRIAVLLTSHNRREKTLRCLESLRMQGAPFVAPGSGDHNSRILEQTDEKSNFDPKDDWSGDRPRGVSAVTLTVFLVDDGSTDGTGDAIRARFPEVKVIQGNGELYWCGGMRLAWERAATFCFDGYLWLNDDTMLRKGALDVIVSVANGHSVASTAAEAGRAVGERLSPVVVVGSSCDPESGLPTYGERGLKGVLPPPLEGPRNLRESFNGNVVFVSAAAYEILGNLSRAYAHSFGDIDYGLRARSAGVTVLVAPGFAAECARNGPPKWHRPELSIFERFRALRGPTGISPRELRHLMRVQGAGLWWLSMAKLYCSAIAPRFFARNSCSE